MRSCFISLLLPLFRSSSSATPVPLIPFHPFSPLLFALHSSSLMSYFAFSLASFLPSFCISVVLSSLLLCFRSFFFHSAPPFCFLRGSFCILSLILFSFLVFCPSHLFLHSVVSFCKALFAASSFLDSGFRSCPSCITWFSRYFYLSRLPLSIPRSLFV